jgi:hypothetical protein
MKNKGIETIAYYPTMKIVNIHQLPKGKGCRFLECIHGEFGTLIAKQWRKTPKCGRNAVLVDFDP